MELKLPELGEGIHGGTIVKIRVAPGQAIIKDDILFEIETGKATVEIPATSAGRVDAIHVHEAEEAKVGQLLMTYTEAAGITIEMPTPRIEERPAAPPAPVETPRPAPLPPVPEPAPAAAPVSMPPPASEPRPTAAPVAPTSETPSAPRSSALAAPSVRKFARELGVDVGTIAAEGARISVEDVKRHARSLLTGEGGDWVGPQAVQPKLPDFSKWGPVERETASTIRRRTAAHMSLAWSTIPHVTQTDKADATAVERLRDTFGKRVEKQGGRLTVTSILLKVVAAALKVFPKFNASLDLAQREIVLKRYVHIGVAVDTPRGLLVPVVRDADKKNILQISIDLAELAEKSRDGKIAPDELSGGTFTITNLGGIGGGHFTPIINFPEVAILGVGRSATEPVLIDGRWEPREMLPLSLSYDHRLIDGAEAARFLRWIVEALEQPFLLELEG